MSCRQTYWPATSEYKHTPSYSVNEYITWSWRNANHNMNHLKLKSTQLTKCPCSQDLKSGYQNVLKGLLKRTIYKETFGFSLKCWHLQGRIPFDQKFRFEFPKFSYVEWNGIFHQARPISFFSRLSTFPTKNYSTKSWKIVMKWLISRKVLHVEKFNMHSEFNSSLIFVRELNLRTFLAG